MSALTHIFTLRKLKLSFHPPPPPPPPPQQIPVDKKINFIQSKHLTSLVIPHPLSGPCEQLYPVKLDETHSLDFSDMTKAITFSY